MSAASRDRLAGGVASLAVVASVAAGIYLMRSPSEERTLRLDQRRVAALMALSGAVDVYWTRHKSLPSSLDELRSEPVGRLDLTDPASGSAYEYRRLADRSYEVCANFERDSSAPEGPAFGDGVWAHRAGRQCFPREPRTLER
jgi:hypothetical protein